MKCVIHGSFNKHFEEVQSVVKTFKSAGIEVLAPAEASKLDHNDGFVRLTSDRSNDPRVIELLYLQKLKDLNTGGFSYFLNLDGYLGRTASYELGIAQAAGIPCFFLESPKDHPVYLHRNSIIDPQNLIDFIKLNGSLPSPRPLGRKAHRLWRRALSPASVIATGAIIRHKKEILLVKTHKWGGRYSMVGGRLKPGELVKDALKREIREETGLKANIRSHLCTFDQIKSSGYYLPTHHLFVDYAVESTSKKVRLNHEAQNYIWAEPTEALSSLDIEPNARHTLNLYASSSST
jgi:ADP-ribose pyrophosphatase YjhB (NUDIX family)